MVSETIVVIGAGPAGVRAAETLVEAGIRPVVIDEARSAGGQIYRRQPPNFTRAGVELYGSEAAKAIAIHRTFAALQPKIDYRPATLVWGIWERELHLASHGRGLDRLACDRVIIATGASDRIMPLPGWTLPGVFTLGAAQVALKGQAVAIGHRPVFMGAGPLLYLVAWQYLKAGVPPVAVLDTSRLRDWLRGTLGLLQRPRVLLQGMKYMHALRRAGVEIQTGIQPQGYVGTERVEGVRFLDARGRTRHIACDAAGFGWHLRAEAQLADLAGVPFGWNPVMQQHLPDCALSGRTSVQDVYLAGDGALLAGADAAELSGRLAALSALEDAGVVVDALEKAVLSRQLTKMLRFRDGLARAFPWPGRRLAASLADDVVLCRCEEITAGTLRCTGRAFSATEVNRAKALNRVGMGRCQSRVCGLAAAEILAETLDVTVESVGRIRTQAPVKPVISGGEAI